MALALAAALGTAPAFAAGPDTAAVPSPHAIAIPKWFNESFLDFREDAAEAAKSGRRLMVYFGQDGCPYCVQLMKNVLGQPDIERAARARVVAVAVNLWGDRETTWIDGIVRTEKDLAVHLQVQFTPTVWFFDAQGRVILRLNGRVPAARFREALDYVALEEGRPATFAAYLARKEPAAPAVPAAGTIDLRAMLRRDKPLMVIVTRTGCTDCAEWERALATHPALREESARLTVARVDAGGSRNVVPPSGAPVRERDWAPAAQVAYTPALLFFDGDGREVFRTEAVLRPFHTAAVMDYVSSGAYRSQPNFQRFLQARADRLRAQGKAVELW
ncbi:MAG: thioredoxin fold domain-containing protein [Betaproteobacteria bacterium]|nr:thioredoxin fold domain-containing protein [Betaproteobacteria bacterium]